MLLTTGCSIVYGAELDEDDWFSEEHWTETFSHKLAQHLNIDYTCTAGCGNSNRKIFRDLIRWFSDDNIPKYANNQKTNLTNCTHMVVFWTQWFREEIFATRCGEIEKGDDGIGQHSDMGFIQYAKDAKNISKILSPMDLKIHHDYWKGYLIDGQKHLTELVIYMKTIQLLCEQHGIKLVQGTILNDFKSYWSNIVKSKGCEFTDEYCDKMRDMLGNLSKTSKIGISDTYDCFMTKRFLGEKWIKSLTYGHPNAEAHAEYAEYLYNIFQENFLELNDVPTTSVVFTAADSKYFHMFGTEFVYSFSRMGHDVHVHLVNPDEKCHDLVKKLKSVCRTKVTFSHEVTDIQQYRKDGEDDTYYTCARWIKLPEILESAGEVMVLDIDCMARKPFVFPHNENLGFYPRFENEDLNMKILAGIFYITKEKIKLANSKN